MKSIVCVVFCCAVLQAAEWPRFRGPNGTGVGIASNLPSEIGPKKNVAWRTAIPKGFSSPILNETTVFLTAQEDTKLHTIAIDRKTGAVKWKVESPAPLGPWKSPNSPAAPTPATDGSNVYVFFDHFGLISYDGAGEERWRIPLAPFNTPYGSGTSPVVHGNTVLLQMDQDTNSYLLAVDKNTGKQLWKTGRPHATHGFSSPVVYQPRRGQPEVIVSGAYQIDAYALDTGKPLWWVSGMAWQAKSIPVIHNDVLYVHSWMASLAELGHKEVTLPWDKALQTFDKDKDGKLSKDESPDASLVPLWFLYDLDKDNYLGPADWKYLLARSGAQNGLYAIRLGAGRGDLSKSAILWRYDKGLPNIPSPLLYNNVLYILREGGILTSLNPASGTVIKQGRIEGAVDAYFASPVAADGKIYTAGQDGKVAVIKPGGQWEVASVNSFDEEIWATPAAADGQIFLRTQAALYCFELAKGENAVARL